MGVLSRLVAPFTMKRSANDNFSARKTAVQKVKRAHALGGADADVLEPYRAVAIEAGDFACAAARGIQGERFLVASCEAPVIPLAGCDAASCSCRYVHYDDRRDLTHEDRRQWSALRTELFSFQGSQNRRSKKRGRRKTD